MGTIKSGIPGGFSGKVGAVVGASWKSIEYMRGLPRKSNKPRSKGQKAQNSKMVLFRGFLLGIGSTIGKCYQNYSKYSAMNSALSYNMLHSVAGSYPDFVVDFPNVLYAKGDLHGSWSPKAIPKSENKVKFCWKNRPYSNMSAATDEVKILMYCTDTSEFVIYHEAAVRSNESVTLVVPPEVRGHAVHCYLSFYSEQFKISSTNEYLGEISV